MVFVCDKEVDGDFFLSARVCAVERVRVCVRFFLSVSARVHETCVCVCVRGGRDPVC